MKTMKKFAALLLVVVMMAAMLVVPANAAGTKIEVSDPIKKAEYKLYKMLDLESNGAADDAAHTYTIASGWENFFKADGIKDVYVTIDALNQVTWKADIDEATKATFAKLAAAWAKANAADAAAIATVTAAGSDALTLATLDSKGWYLVTSSAGTAVMMDTLYADGNTLAIDEKNELPTINKTLTGGEFAIGSKYTYEIVVTVEQGGTNYIVHDMMGNGLQFDNNVTVKHQRGTDEPTPVAGTNYTVVDTATCEQGVAGCTFEIRIDNDYLESIETGDKLIINYSATILPTGNYVNEAKITSGGGVGGDDVSGTTTTNPMELTINKTDGSANLLDGAKFKLYSNVDCTNEVKLILDGGVYRPATVSETPVGVITAGTAKLTGLPVGTYYLKETDAPEGYNALEDAIEIVVFKETTEDGENTTITYKAKIDDTVVTTFDVVNQTGGVFPSTGGIGTTIFYCVGGLLVLAAIVVLVTRRRVVED